MSDPRPPKKYRMLDLFSGTGSVGRKFEEIGYEVFSIDIMAKFKPTLCIDINTWDYRSQFPRGHLRVITAGPPAQNTHQLSPLDPEIWMQQIKS